MTRLLLSTLLACLCLGARGQGKHPNIVIIFMDDMGYGDPECYNGLLYHTPNINRLAAEGMRFTNFYAAQAVCTASRAALLTGCYPNRLGISGAFGPWTRIALNPKEETLASMLKSAGYHTGMIGKWHLGSKAPFFPIHYGFDEYLGLPYSNDMWPVDYNGKPMTDTADWRYKCPPLPLIEGDSTIRYIRNLDDQGELTGIYTRRACRFIRDNKDHPFFLYLAHSMVHVPIAASAAFRGKSGQGLFADVMLEVDWSVGEIMRTLKEAGVDRNTLVIFTSDNGPWLAYGNHAGNTGGLREGKGTSWEGGQREPCLMRWPDVIPAGTVCNRIAATLDVLPTLARIAGCSLPANRIDGVDIYALLKGDPTAHPRDELVYYYHTNSLEGVRQGQWKLVVPHRSRTYKLNMPGRDGYPGKQPDIDVPMALYDLSTDPGETLDVQSEHPDIVRELQALVDKYRADLGDDLTHTPCSGCRAPATIP
ncbi:sulfatase family protein [Dinghuibacter silviterrae]|nr:sulfatase [Dinghuibacter silviterrae]